MFQIISPLCTSLAMHFISVVTFFVALGCAPSVAIPTAGGSKCSQPRIRKEWSVHAESSILERPRSILTFFPRRTLSNSQQDAYINAVQCLMKTPSKGTSFYDTLENRYDDFVAMHINATRGFSRLSICSVVRRLTYSQEATTRRPLSLPAETALRVRHLILFLQSL